MKIIYYVIIAILIPFTMFVLMHAPVFGTECKPVPFAHCHFGIFTPNPSFLIIPAYAVDGYVVEESYNYFPMIFVAIGVVIFSLYIWKKRE